MRYMAQYIIQIWVYLLFPCFYSYYSNNSLQKSELQKLILKKRNYPNTPSRNIILQQTYIQYVIFIISMFFVANICNICALIIRMSFRYSLCIDFFSYHFFTLGYLILIVLVRYLILPTLLNHQPLFAQHCIFHILFRLIAWPFHAIFCPHVLKFHCR